MRFVRSLRLQPSKPAGIIDALIEWIHTRDLRLKRRINRCATHDGTFRIEAIEETATHPSEKAHDTRLGIYWLSQSRKLHYAKKGGHPCLTTINHDTATPHIVLRSFEWLSRFHVL